MVYSPPVHDSYQSLYVVIHLFLLRYFRIVTYSPILSLYSSGALKSDIKVYLFQFLVSILIAYTLPLVSVK